MSENCFTGCPAIARTQATVEALDDSTPLRELMLEKSEAKLAKQIAACAGCPGPVETITPYPKRLAVLHGILGRDQNGYEVTVECGLSVDPTMHPKLVSYPDSNADHQSAVTGAETVPAPAYGTEIPQDIFEF